MTAAPAILVVGSDGLLGGGLEERLARAGRRVLRTTRHGGDGAIGLDLAADPGTWSIPDGPVVACLCAAVTSMDRCRERPDMARAVNVTGTLELARRIVARGGRVVFPSTNMVFDGGTPFQRADAAPSPRSAYGRLKAEAEAALLALGGPTCIVRLTKVLGGRVPLFERWAASLCAGDPIRPFSDLVMAPVTLAHAVDVLARACTDSMTGILQVSACRDVSYAEAALRLAAILPAEAALVRPVPASGVEHVARHTTLDTSRVRAELGLEPPEPWDAIDAAAAAVEIAT